MEAVTDGPFEKLEAVTGTLQKEREFFDALMAARPIALVVNRLIHLSTFFQGAERFIPPYLSHHAARLFPADPHEVSAVLSNILEDITRSARLAVYLCVKGIPDQALSILRSPVERVGIYTHVWHDPTKYRFVADSDSKDFFNAFRSTNNRLLQKDLDARKVKYRFMHCKQAQSFSNVYSLLSAHFVHGRPSSLTKAANYSCEFVDRDAPSTMGAQYELVQSIMSLTYMELFSCIPENDWLEDELAPLSLVSALLLPVVAFPSDEHDSQINLASDALLEALRNVRVERP
jgi:hypothetical protein